MVAGFAHGFVTAQTRSGLYTRCLRQRGQSVSEQCETSCWRWLQGSVTPRAAAAASRLAIRKAAGTPHNTVLAPQPKFSPLYCRGARMHSPSSTRSPRDITPPAPAGEASRSQAAGGRLKAQAQGAAAAAALLFDRSQSPPLSNCVHAAVTRRLLIRCPGSLLEGTRGQGAILGACAVMRARAQTWNSWQGAAGAPTESTDSRPTPAAATHPLAVDRRAQRRGGAGHQGRQRLVLGESIPAPALGAPATFGRCRLSGALGAAASLVAPWARQRAKWGCVHGSELDPVL